ncbi:MAG: carboxypeptidase-like regulatory domain-containing protein, partial [Bacteroidia bacterium]|nr:carboxypeptidase-like regulatory domain-containing protein [Bacteroidia bacterium]
MTLYNLHTFRLFLIAITLFCANSSTAQFRLRGTVYDSTRSYPMEAVSVLSTSGRGTSTNSTGQYEIIVNEKDSIWFSYLGKPTIKYPVATIYNEMQFDIALHVTVPVMKEIRIRPRNYRFDSLQNRLDYAKVFNYEKPKIAPSVTSSGVGFDLEQIISMFQFRKNRSMLSFQKRLLEEEQEKYIDFRFSQRLVR